MRLGGGIERGYKNPQEWLQLVKRHYKKVVWLNPKMAPGRAPWREAETAVKEMFPMYKLTVDGLNQAMIKLMVNK